MDFTGRATRHVCFPKTPSAGLRGQRKLSNAEYDTLARAGQGWRWKAAANGLIFTFDRVVHVRCERFVVPAGVSPVLVMVFQAG
jgi:hypothetical protein